MFQKLVNLLKISLIKIFGDGLYQKLTQQAKPTNFDRKLDRKALLKIIMKTYKISSDYFIHRLHSKLHN